jgi:Uma2 family endonuclease
MSTSTTPITVEEYSRLPKPKGGHYELHHGELKLMTAPKWGHTQIQKRLERTPLCLWRFSHPSSMF